MKCEITACFSFIAFSILFHIFHTYMLYNNNCDRETDKKIKEQIILKGGIYMYDSDNYTYSN
ncbi:MAG: hypothetical protein ACI4I1_06515, partial [Oscillospiraceae bacterium]